MIALAFVTADDAQHAPAHLCDERDRHRARWRRFIAIAAVVRFDRDHVPASARSSCNPTTSAAAAASACRNWRSPDMLQFPERHGPVRILPHPRPAAAQRLSAGLPGLRLGSAAWPISCCWSPTFWIGLRTVFVRTPWQPYLIAPSPLLSARCVEGFVIDTDHWRHFFLLLGMIWGLAAATFNHGRGRTDAAAGGTVRPMSALEFAAASARRRGAAPCAGCGSACRSTRARRFCSTSAAGRAAAGHASARRISARHRRPVLDRQRPRRRRPARLRRARRRRLRARRLRSQRGLRTDGTCSADRTAARAGARQRQSDRSSQRPLSCRTRCGRSAARGSRPPHHRLLGLGIAAAAGRVATRASATCTKSGCRARFTRDAVAAATDLPVHVVPHPLPPMTATPNMRGKLGLPDDALVVLNVFHLGSAFSRKNPLAAIAAFRRAFGDAPRSRAGDQADRQRRRHGRGANSTRRSPAPPIFA